MLGQHRKGLNLVRLAGRRDLFVAITLMGTFKGKENANDVSLKGRGEGEGGGVGIISDG